MAESRQHQGQAILVLFMGTGAEHARLPLSEKDLVAHPVRWPDHVVGTVDRFEAGEKGPAARVWIELLPLRGRPGPV